MARDKTALGLRGQFLLGVAVIMVVATVSVVGITSFAMRTQLTSTQLKNGQVLGTALAQVLGGLALAGELTPERVGMLASSATSGPSLVALEVVDHRLNPLGRSGSPDPTAAQAPGLAKAVRLQQQVTQVVKGEPETYWVATPFYAQGEVRGAVGIQGPLAPDSLQWPLLFWGLMVINGLALVFFLERVVSKYVIRPVQAMQQAAAQVADGDLSVRLAQSGAFELSSLAESFNAMTRSVQEQLQRLEHQRQELATSREHLIRSEKLASVGRLAAGVAHEVGNPLQSIIGFAEMMSSSTLSPEQQADFLQRIQAEAHRIHFIVRELLDFARPVQDEVESVSLQQVVEQSRQLVGPQKRIKEVEILSEGLDTLPPVAANGQRLVQVLVNLLLNAADAMEGQGTIWLTGGLLEDEGQVELLVANSGPLIPPQDHHRIFDPFFSTKDPGQGTGLGLSVAQSIAESYGGHLDLVPQAPQTTFRLLLHTWSGDLSTMEQKTGPQDTAR